MMSYQSSIKFQTIYLLRHVCSPKVPSRDIINTDKIECACMTFKEVHSFFCQELSCGRNWERHGESEIRRECWLLSELCIEKVRCEEVPVGTENVIFPEEIDTPMESN
jgi:hypothetical protein